MSIVCCLLIVVIGLFADVNEVVACRCCVLVCVVLLLRVVDCRMLSSVVGWLLFGVCCSLFAVRSRCLLLLLVVCCCALLRVVGRSLFVERCLLCDVCCVVCGCVLFVV